MSQNTLNSYLSDLKFMQNYFISRNKNSPLEIEYPDLQQYIQNVANHGLSARTQARYISSIKSFFEYLILERRITDNPSELLEVPKIGLYLPDTLSEKEIELIISQIDLSHPLGHRNKAMLEILYGCGLRVSELVNLKFSDLFSKENFIRVRGKGNKERLVPIANVTIKYLYQYTEHTRKTQIAQKEHEDIIFLNRRGRPLSRVMIFMIIKRLKEKANMNKKVSPHTFRHSFASHLLHNGADIRSIQLMLGHESITTTEIYTHLEQKQIQEAILKYHPRNQ